jgi:hypothetical protein
VAWKKALELEAYLKYFGGLGWRWWHGLLRTFSRLMRYDRCLICDTGQILSGLERHLLTGTVAGPSRQRRFVPYTSIQFLEHCSSSTIAS